MAKKIKAVQMMLDGYEQLVVLDDNGRIWQFKNRDGITAWKLIALPDEPTKPKTKKHTKSNK